VAKVKDKQTEHHRISNHSSSYTETLFLSSECGGLSLIFTVALGLVILN